MAENNEKGNIISFLKIVFTHHQSEKQVVNSLNTG